MPWLKGGVVALNSVAGGDPPVPRKPNVWEYALEFGEGVGL